MSTTFYAQNDAAVISGGVTSLNDLDGALTLAAGSGITIIDNGDDTITISASGSSGVTSLNSLTGALTLAAGSNVTITPSGGDTLTISATGGGGGGAGLNAYTAVGITSAPTLNTGGYRTVVFDTSFVDYPGTNYNTSTGTYTAPNTGTYVISAVILTATSYVPTDTVGFNVITRNTTTSANISFNYFWGYTGNTGNSGADPYTWTMGPFIANLTAGDTVQLWILPIGANMPLSAVVPQANQFIIYQISP